MASIGYSQKTISTFEIIGAYFVDVFYNHIYATAYKNHKLGNRVNSERSLTEDYKMALSAYKLGLRRDKKYYESTIKGALEYYRTYTKFTTITLNNFIGELLQQFLPDEHWRVLTESDRYLFLNKIVSDITSKFIEKIMSFEYMQMVIDDRSNGSNTRRWIDDFVRIQIIERENMFSAFIKGANGEQKSAVDEDVMQRVLEERDKLWSQLQATVEQKCKLENDLARAKKVAEELYRRLQLAASKPPPAPVHTPVSTSVSTPVPPISPPHESPVPDAPPTLPNLPNLDGTPIKKKPGRQTVGAAPPDNILLPDDPDNQIDDYIVE